jgi:hypothetical protein
MDSILMTFDLCGIDVDIRYIDRMHDLSRDAVAGARETRLNTDDEIPIRHCSVYVKNEHCILVVDDGVGKPRYLAKGRLGFTFEVLSEPQMQSLKKLHHLSLTAYLQRLLPDYQPAHYLHKNYLYEHWSVTCYPLEISNKVEMHERFALNYQLPEKQAKFARPILELECVGMLGPCIRCYLTLAGRPRAGKEDKDITQNAKGEVVFSHVKLMNFSDPLRALTWVEDYLKNREHGMIAKTSPIIRSFLITLKDYEKALSAGEMLLVDADRAPGQVRFQGCEQCPLTAVKYSLLSFMEGEVKSGDGAVKSLNELSLYLFEEPLAAHLIEDETKIAHQHGRPIEGRVLRYHALNIETKAGQLLDARNLERDLAGFNLEPTSSIAANAAFLLHGKSKNKKSHSAKPKRTPLADKENQPPQKHRK